MGGRARSEDLAPDPLPQQQLSAADGVDHGVKLTEIGRAGQEGTSSPAGSVAVRIRLATGADVEEIVSLVHSSYRGETSRVGWTTEADLLDGLRTNDEAVAALVAGGGDGRAVILVAELGAAIVGCCAVDGDGPAGRQAGQADASGQAEAAGQANASGQAGQAEAAGQADEARRGGQAEAGGQGGVAHFGMFAVRPQLQGGGIGRQLVAAAERHAAESLASSSMRMEVIRQRDELIAWYRRLGYEPTGETAPFPYGDECFGLPRRDDLEFVVLAKPIGTSER